MALSMDRLHSGSMNKFASVKIFHYENPLLESLLLMSFGGLDNGSVEVHTDSRKQREDEAPL